MVVESFFGKWWHGDRVAPPGDVEKAFLQRFPEPLNPEWYISGDVYEVIFYEKEVEMIARYQKDGLLKEWQENISPAMLPPFIQEKASEMGEIMNAIVIHTMDTISYELIVRDIRLERFSLHFNSDGIPGSRNPL